MSATALGVTHNVGPFIPELSRQDRSNFNSNSLSCSQESPSPQSATREKTKFSSQQCLSAYQCESKELQPYPVCTCCQRPIAESYLYRIRGQTWHESCATCSVCSAELTDVCFLYDGRLFCPRDYDRLHATRCVNCRQPMRSHELFMRAHYPKTHPAAIDAHQQPLLFHVSCFTCCVCQQPLAAGDPYTIDPRSNRPICRSDYLSSRDASECSARLSDSSELRRHALSLQPTTPSKQSESQNLGGNSREVHRNGHSLVIPSGCLSDSAGPTERYFDGKPLNSHTCHGNRRIRTSLTDEQRLHLHKAFEVNQRPSKLTRECLAHELGVPIRVVQVWFQNQRARDKRSSHSKRHWPRNQTEWSKTKPLSNTHVSPNALTPSPRTSVESGSNPDFGEISLGGLRCSGVPDLSSPKHSDSQPWRPAWPVSNDTDPTT